MTDHEPSNQITIKQIEPLPHSVYEVTITGNKGSRSTHTVSLDQSYYELLTGGSVMPDELIRHSFLFLLERESKDEILPEFQLPVIATYFPEFESAVQAHLHHI